MDEELWKGRVVLLGDAAACPTPMSVWERACDGRSYVVAGELRANGGDHAAAFSQYEAAMRPLVTEA
jgi:hypothetical protein